ncbi:MAG: PrpF domain-containing protein, partial [Pseudomonadota bacterium]
RAVNTGAKVSARVQTPGGKVEYEGTAQVDGVPGLAAPVDLQFMDTVGGVTGELFPTGQRVDRFEGVEVTCMDVAMPMVIARAFDLGVRGNETAAELDENQELLARMEAIRIQAGAAMGMGDVSKSVTPKFGLLSEAQNGGAATVRYFMPWNCHPTLAVTGSQCLAACLLCPGTVGEGFYAAPNTAPVAMRLEHPMGQLAVTVNFTRDGSDFEMISAGLVRTARKLASGDVFVPGQVWQAG